MKILYGLLILLLAVIILMSVVYISNNADFIKMSLGFVVMITSISGIGFFVKKIFKDKKTN